MSDSDSNELLKDLKKNENENDNHLDSTQLEENFAFSNKLIWLQKRYSLSKIIIMGLSVLIFLAILINFIIWKQMKFYQIQQKIQFQMLYSLSKTTSKSAQRKKIATLWLTRVALVYHPSWDANQLASIVDFVYERGEVKYNIPVEFWGTFIALESEWNPRAQNPTTKATGLLQLLLNTGSYIARLLDVTYHGYVTLKNPRMNLILGMKYFKDLADIYGLKFALCGYNWGEGKVSSWATSKKIPKNKRFYYDKFLKTKAYLEDKLGEPYNIPQIDSMEASIAKKKYLNRKMKELEIKKSKKKVDPKQDSS